jgi:NAD(P)-dependent dehydrogenase (short-subunit alcohol dehydrogenase family)
MRPSALLSDSVALVTGGASGIGFAAARRFAEMGFAVCVADLGVDRLAAAAGHIAAVSPHGADRVLTAEADVSKPDDLSRLQTLVTERFGGVDILMNNAGVQPGSAIFGPVENWERVLSVNLWGIINGTRAFTPAMIARGRPGLIINTGSKQGITTPPGDPAYNVSKAGVKVFTEALEYELRNTPGSALSAHLLIPGYVFTPLAVADQTSKPSTAWTADQTIDFMMERLEHDDFYILCPDNAVPRALDEKRIAWSAGDIIENRPALSRWHPDYKAAFADYRKT